MTGFYQGASWIATSLRDGDAVVLKGTWSFITRPRTPLRTPAQRRAYQREYLERMATQGYKIGVRIRAGQTIEQFVFRGRRDPVVLVPDAEVTAELSAAFPADAAEQWVGLVPPPGSRRRHTFPEPTRIAYPFTVRVSPVYLEPQLLPVVLTHSSVAFAQHYLLDVFVLSTNIEKMELRLDALK
jgi:hypothetical protein